MENLVRNFLIISNNLKLYRNVNIPICYPINCVEISIHVIKTNKILCLTNKSNKSLTYYIDILSHKHLQRNKSKVLTPQTKVKGCRITFNLERITWSFRVKVEGTHLVLKLLFSFKWYIDQGPRRSKWMENLDNRAANNQAHRSDTNDENWNDTQSFPMVHQPLLKGRFDARSSGTLLLNRDMYGNVSL